MEVKYNDQKNIAYFDGKIYKLISGSARFPKKRFFRGPRLGKRGHQRSLTRLHRDVWIYHNGPILSGHDIHHKDHDYLNNDISNLQSIKHPDHISLHGPDQIGKIVSQETRLKMSIAKIGRKIPLETRIKMSLAHRR